MAGAALVTGVASDIGHAVADKLPESGGAKQRSRSAYRCGVLDEDGGASLPGALGRNRPRGRLHPRTLLLPAADAASACSRPRSRSAMRTSTIDPPSSHGRSSSTAPSA